MSKVNEKEYIMIDGKEILITGGSGTLGKELVIQLKRNYKPRGIRIYSRSEENQRAARVYFLEQGIPLTDISFILGDIADSEGIKRAMHGVDIVIHTAAMKQVPACEDNPLEAERINVLGAQNVMIAAWENCVEQVMNIGTDKDTYPTNIYGITKALAEKTFVFGAIYTGLQKPYFKTCRYGNVLGSRGSIIPVWKKQVQDTGKITVTNRQMTRFFIPLPEVAKFVLDRLFEKETGKIYVPRMKSISIGDFAEYAFPGVPQKEIGIRPGEKMHESIITAEESLFVDKREGYYTIYAYDMKLNNTEAGIMNTYLAYPLDSCNNHDKWGEEIMEWVK